MRIIGGVHKGRPIVMPKGIRPTQDKVRKAVFDILGDVSGLSFLELFAGSGAVGLEALSRGVKDLTMIEYNRDCLLAIKKNIESLGNVVCQLHPVEVDRALSGLARQGRKFDIVFLDPPYYQDISKKALQSLSAYDILAPNALVVAQHFKKDLQPQEAGQLRMVRQYKYGDTLLTVYKSRVIS